MIVKEDGKGNFTRWVLKEVGSWRMYCLNPKGLIFSPYSPSVLHQIGLNIWARTLLPGRPVIPSPPAAVRCAMRSVDGQNPFVIAVNLVSSLPGRRICRFLEANLQTEICFFRQLQAFRCLGVLGKLSTALAPNPTLSERPDPNDRRIER